MFPAFLITLQLLFLSICPLFAGVVISNKPVAKIKGIESYLDQPEGLCFSPSGDCIAVANAHNDCLTIYSRVGNSGPHYTSAPACIIKSAYFNYIHEVDFSPCGNYLTVAVKLNNSVVCLKRNDSEPISFDSKPYWIFDHRLVPELRITADVAFSHSGEFLGVVNRKDSTVVLFKELKGKECRYDPSPVQVISENDLDKYDIAAAHGLAFSPDGTKLAITTKGYFGSNAQPSLTIFKKEAIDEHESQFVPSFFFRFPGNICPHGISFHPSGKYLALTDCEGDLLIFEMEPDEQTFTIVKRIPVRRGRKRETAKGVAFSPCGNYLAFTTMNDSIRIYEFQCDEPPNPLM